MSAFLEVGKEQGLGDDLSSSSSEEQEESSAGVATGGVVQQKASSQLSNILNSKTGIDAIKWVAALCVALTPVAHVILIGEDGVYCSLGPDLTQKSNTKEGLAAAIQDVYNSQGG
eukprot:936851-Ditylum_brightwellii.AAC.1